MGLQEQPAQPTAFPMCVKAAQICFKEISATRHSLPIPYFKTQGRVRENDAKWKPDNSFRNILINIQMFLVL